MSILAKLTDGKVELTDGWTNPTRGADFCAKCSAARAARAKKESPDGLA